MLAITCLLLPSAILHALSKQAFDEGRHVYGIVASIGDSLAVDALLCLALPNGCPPLSQKTSPTVRFALSVEGFKPNSRNCDSVLLVAVHG